VAVVATSARREWADDSNREVLGTLFFDREYRKLSVGEAAFAAVPTKKSPRLMCATDRRVSGFEESSSSTLKAGRLLTVPKASIALITGVVPDIQGTTISPDCVDLDA
jgi:hypothetical protein